MVGLVAVAAIVFSTMSCGARKFKVIAGHYAVSDESNAIIGYDSTDREKLINLTLTIDTIGVKETSCDTGRFCG